MQQLSRPIVLSIAGYDPSGGAGLLADVKTIEQHKVYGIGIVTALTFQTENDFFTVNWVAEKKIALQVKKYVEVHRVKVVKFGIIENWKVLDNIIDIIKRYDKKTKIIVDPILESSSGFGFAKGMSNSLIIPVLEKIDLLTPNYDEILTLSNTNDGIAGAKQLSQYCNIFLKGGHNRDNVGTDYLFTQKADYTFKSGLPEVYAKHGSGCVLSAAIASNLALGIELAEACGNAKQYTEQFLNSNKSLLGYHVQ